VDQIYGDLITKFNVNLTKLVDHENEVKFRSHLPGLYVPSMINVWTSMVNLGCMIIKKMS
jgi:hypothetical protein